MENSKNAAKIIYQLVLTQEEKRKIKEASDVTGITMKRIIVDGSLSHARFLMKRHQPRSTDYKNM